MSSSIENIEKVLGAKRFGDRSAQIDWILTDSRSLCFPEETLFFALKTKRNDGHKYLPELYERGVRNFVVGELPADMKSFQDANFLQLANPLKGLQKLAEKHREQFQIPVIGITGSNGKTIVKEWLYQLLSPDRVVTRSPRSYNSQIGVPLSVWLMNERTELAIFEAGISEMGEMEALQTIIKPTVGILTNIGGAHQENFFSLQDKCMEKLTLFKDCDVIIYDGDNELISSCVAKSLFTSREIAWSKKDNERPLFIESIQKGEHVTTIKYRYLGMPNEFSIPFIDDASIENSLHCLAVALYMMVSPEQITERMARLEQIAMRLEVKEGKNGCVLINDSYNSDLASLDIALDFMSRRSDDKGKKRTLILSDMLETGQSSKLLYRQVAELVHSRGVEKIIGVGEEIRTAAARFEIEKYFFRTTEELLESDLLAGLRNEVILVKGSRAFHFDRISDRLELKVHETILEVNLGAADELARQLRLRDMGGIIVVDFIDMNEAENRQKLYERMCANMQKDRARHNILPLSKFGLMQITRQRVRPAMDVNTTETCPTCFGKGTIKSSILFTDTLESKIDYLVNKLKIKKFSLHIHPYIAAYVNQGLVSLKRKWQMKYGFGIKIIPNQKLAFLEYVFYDLQGEEIDMKEEIEIK